MQDNEESGQFSLIPVGADFRSATKKYMHPIVLSIQQFELFGRTLGPLHIYSYGVFLALSFMAGLIVFIRDGKKVGLNSEAQLDLMIYVIVFSIVGARIFYVLINAGEFSNDPLGAMKIYQGGLSFHGGAIGSVLAIIYFTWRRKESFWHYTDCAIRPMIVGAAIARFGCFFNGCCYGHEWHGPWAVVFPILHDGIPRHPVQFYDMGLHIILFFVITWAFRFRRRNGDILAFYLMGFSILRFITELFRSGATGKVFALGLTQAQWGSFAIMAIGLYLYLRKAPLEKTPEPKKKKKSNKKSGK